MISSIGSCSLKPERRARVAAKAPGQPLTMSNTSLSKTKPTFADDQHGYAARSLTDMRSKASQQPHRTVIRELGHKGFRFRDQRFEVDNRSLHNRIGEIKTIRQRLAKVLGRWSVHPAEIGDFDKAC